MREPSVEIHEINTRRSIKRTILDILRSDGSRTKHGESNLHKAVGKTNRETIHMTYETILYIEYIYKHNTRIRSNAEYVQDQGSCINQEKGVQTGGQIGLARYMGIRNAAQQVRQLCGRIRELRRAGLVQGGFVCHDTRLFYRGPDANCERPCPYEKIGIQKVPQLPTELPKIPGYCVDDLRNFRCT